MSRRRNSSTLKLTTTNTILHPERCVYSVAYTDALDIDKSKVYPIETDEEAWTKFKDVCNRASVGSNIKLLKSGKVIAELKNAGRSQLRG